MESEQVRTCFTVADEPVKEVREAIRCPKKIKEMILSKLKKNSTFVPWLLPTVDFDPQREETGFFHSSFKLSELRAVLGLNEADDNKILEVLDSLAKRGEIKIFFIGMTRELHFNDIAFMAELALAKRTLGGCDVVETLVRIYHEDPLKSKERDSATILNPADRVKAIRLERDELFRMKFGQAHPSAELEKLLRREDAEDEAAERRLLNEIAKDVRELKIKNAKEI